MRRGRKTGVQTGRKAEKHSATWRTARNERREGWKGRPTAEPGFVNTWGASPAPQGPPGAAAGVAATSPIPENILEHGEQAAGSLQRGRSGALQTWAKMPAFLLTVRAPPRQNWQGSTPVSQRQSTPKIPAEREWLGAQGPSAQTAPPGALGGRLSRILRFAPERCLWAVPRPLRPNLGPYAPQRSHFMPSMKSLRRPLHGAPREGRCSPPRSQNI